MKVICIDRWSEVDGYSYDICRGLTIGKSYEVIKESFDKESYILKDDTGETTSYFKWRFKITTREDKLNRILNEKNL